MFDFLEIWARKPNFRTMPKVSAGGELDEDELEGGPSPKKKPRIEINLENGVAKDGKRSTSENVVLDDEDEKIMMVG